MIDHEKMMQHVRSHSYVLEQIFSPLVVFAASEYDELKTLAAGCITKHHAHHYLGFAATQWRLFSKESPPRIKPLLHSVLVTRVRCFVEVTGIRRAFDDTCHGSGVFLNHPQLFVRSHITG